MLFPPASFPSRISLCKYRTDISGSLNAAFIISFRISGSAPGVVALAGAADSAEARAGLVDQTREEAVGDNGRNAIGPVGRKR